MDIAGSSLQQTTVALSMIKNKAQADQALVNMVQKSIESSPSVSRGQHLNITV